MADIYVLVVCDLGRTEAIASGLEDIDEVDEVHMEKRLLHQIVSTL